MRLMKVDLVLGEGKNSSDIEIAFPGKIEDKQKMQKWSNDIMSTKNMLSVNTSGHIVQWINGFNH